MNNNMIKMYVVFSAALLTLFTIVYSGTYAYISPDASTTGTGNIRETTEQLNDLVIAKLNGEIRSDKIIPGDIVSMSFTISNTNTRSMCYKLMFDNVSNTFVNKDNLTYTLSYVNGINETNIISNTTFPTNNSLIADNLSIKANSTDTYKITINYLNTNSNTIADAGHTFSADIVGILSEC